MTIEEFGISFFQNAYRLFAVKFGNVKPELIPVRFGPRSRGLVMGEPVNALDVSPALISATELERSFGDCRTIRSTEGSR